MLPSWYAYSWTKMWIAVRTAPAAAFCFDLLRRFFSAASLHSLAEVIPSLAQPLYTISAPKMCNWNRFCNQKPIRATKRCAIGHQRHSIGNYKHSRIQEPFFRFNPGAELQVLQFFTHLETFRESKTLRGLRPTLSLCRIH